MILREQREIIKNIVRNFFDKLTIAVEIKDEVANGESIRINIETESPQLLIGENGQTLAEIQHLLRLILKKKIGSDIRFDLDVNDYKKKKIAYLQELAKSAADEVALDKTEKEFAPMPAWERRIIHLVIAEREDVESESKNQGSQRCVVIRPKLTRQGE